MTYNVGKMVLQQMQEVFRGKVNDVIICEDIAAEGKLYYTVLVVHDREMAKRLLKIYSEGGENARKTYIADFTWKDEYLIVYDYVRERPLEQFFSTEILNLADCESLCQNLTVECLASGIPYPVLYLILKQEQIHISRDKGVYFGSCLDLETLSEDVKEKECATLCAKIIFKLLEKVNAGKSTSYKLLANRAHKSGYQRFTDLYKDLKMAAVPIKKDSIIKRIKKFFHQHQDFLFRLLLIVCIFLGLLAVIMIISQILFSDIPILRLFTNTFKVIGTESLLQ